MRITVAMATHQGSRFLPAQLESILRQSRLPDELVVHDDASTDRTLDILEDFRHSAPFPVLVTAHRDRAGSAGNFTRALDASQGELVLTCDQDDVWDRGKIAAFEARFIADPDLDMVFTDGEVVDRDLRPMGHGLWDACFFTAKERARAEDGSLFETLLRRNVVTGATMAFRARVWSFARPVPPGLHHDEWIALVASVTGRCVAIPSRSVSYRSHETQQVGARLMGWKELLDHGRRRMGLPQLERESRKYESLLEKLSAMGPGVPQAHREILRQKVDFLHRRRSMRSASRPRILAVLPELGRGGYSRFAHGWKSLLQDLLLP